jgi:hypothetical protein
MNGAPPAEFWVEAENMSTMPSCVFDTQSSWPQIWLSPMNSMRISPSVRSSMSRTNSRMPFRSISRLRRLKPAAP